MFVYCFIDALLEAEASATTPIAQGTSSTTQPPYKSDPVIDLTEDDFPISDDDFMVFADAEQEVLNEEPRPSSPGQNPFSKVGVIHPHTTITQSRKCAAPFHKLRTY